MKHLVVRIYSESMLSCFESFQQNGQGTIEILIDSIVE